MRKDGFITKVKLCYLFLRGYDHVAVMQCPYCGSIHVRKMSENDAYSPKLMDGQIDHHRYTARHVCVSCGANCSEIQTWVKPEFPKKEDNE